MGEVVKLHESDAEKMLKEVLEMAEKQEVESFIISGTLKNGEHFTGKCNVTMDESKILIKNLELDMITRQFIEANYVVPENR
jgi:hypothetical protein